MTTMQAIRDRRVLVKASLKNRGPFPCPELPGFLQIAKAPTKEELAIYSATRFLRWQAHAGIITQREADRRLFFYRVQLEEKLSARSRKLRPNGKP